MAPLRAERAQGRPGDRETDAPEPTPDPLALEPLSPLPARPDRRWFRPAHPGRGR